MKIALLLPLVLFSAGAFAAPMPETPVSWNDGWRFLRADAPATADDAAWEAVRLPHTAKVEEPRAIARHFQGLVSYHRHFTEDAAWRNRKVMLRFDGAMQVAEVFLDGKLLTTHKGGYLPFVVDLTPHLAGVAGTGHLLSVRLDNRDQPHIPPGKPLAALDFTYAGGLYRNVSLLVTDPLHISDPFESEENGGVCIRTTEASPERATAEVEAFVRNDGKSPENPAVRFVLRDASGREVAKADVAAHTIAPGTSRSFSATLAIASPDLWSPDHPALHTLETRLVGADGRVLAVHATRCGLRTVIADPDRGLVLNGQPIRVRGANRHQDAPWLGNALPDDAQWRDIRMLKEAGFNFLRLCHYPQSQAVMDACDELGVMALPCTPGWQWFDNTDEFRDLAKRNVREMIRWHRNHPSAVAWEVSLNETYGHDDFHRECCAIARAELPGALCAGDSYASKDVSHYDIPYCGWPGNGYHRPAAPGFGKKHTSFIREYGDNDTGIGNRVFRGNGEEAMLRQAWTYQWTHNTNNGWNWHIGDCLWPGVDHMRGCAPGSPISAGGPVSWSRLPKFSYFFFQSQRDPKDGPMVFLPHYWDARPSPTRVVVFSNCDEVELRLNGRLVARQKPDDGPDGPLGKETPEEDMLTNYMKTGKTVQDFEKMIEERRKQPRKFPLFTGGNCRHLDHAPFTFPLVPYESGTLEATGFVGGREVAHFVRRTPGKPVALRLRAGTEGRPPAVGRVDAVFVHAETVDADGEVVPAATGRVKFEVTGPAVRIGPEAPNREAGVATVIVRSDGDPGEIEVRATAPGLTPAELRLR